VPLSRLTAQRIFKFNFGAHDSVQLLSEIFIRVAYPVEAFGFKFVSNDPLSFLPGGLCDGSGKEPDLFGQLNNGQADEFQNFHSDGFGFNFPHSARGEKKDGPATTLVFANPVL
jgi:hypothetical protein